MASLMETLVDVLDREHAEYEELLTLSKQKTPVIVAGDLDNLQKITEEEQRVVSRINHLEKQREENINDIANVLNKDVKTLKLVNLIQMIEDRPEDQDKLRAVHDKLQATLREMVNTNEHNRELLQTSLEFVQFDLNLIQAMKTAPETANYTKGAYSSGDIIGNGQGSFDAKQ